MYIPSSNAEHRPEVMLDYMEVHPLAALVTSSSEGLIATHLPLLVDRTRGALGTLAGHIARANPQQRQAREGDEALVIFSGARRVHHAGVLREQGARRQGRPDVELRRRACLRDAALRE